MKSRLFQLINQIVVFCITALTLLNVSAHAVEQTTSSSTSSLQFHYEPPLVFPVVNYGAFRDVTYVLQDDVVKVPGVLNHVFLQNNLKMREEVDGYSVRMSPYAKLAAGALIPRNSLEQGAGINLSQIKRSSSRSGDAATSSVSALIGTILVDETNGIAVKITGAQTNNSTEYLMLERPQIHEVVKDFKIPAQAVYLREANLFPLSDAVSKSIVKTPKRGGDFSLLDQTFPHPLIKLGFDNVELQATLQNGSSVTVVLDGILILDKIRVDGDYSCFDGYSFQVHTGEGIGLQAKVLSQIQEEAVIPLFGIDIPAGVAHVRGGLFLKVGLHGDFTIGLQLSQWAKVTAGIHGGTFFCAPDSFHPIFGFDKGFDGDASFDGEINGALRVGPLLDLELFGFDVVGAGALIGIGASCQVTMSNGWENIDADLYAPLNVYATLLDHQLNLINENFMLAQLHHRYPAGTDSNGKTKVFKVVLQEACAYQKTVWGVVYDLNQPSTNDGQPPPLKDTYVMITIDRPGGGVKPQVLGKTDSNGSFAIGYVNLQKGDKVTVTRIGDVEVSSLPIEATFPFKLVQLDYADFFDDSSKGHVSPARVVDWEQTNKNNDGKKVYKEITYTGKITYDILDAAGTVIDHADTTSTSDGSFKLSYDFKPGQQAVAHVLWNGFDVKSNTVTADTDIMFTILRDPISTSVYNGQDGYVKGRRIEQQHLMIYNLRGTKPVEEEIEGGVDYFLINKPYFICADQSSQLEVRPYIGEKTFRQKSIAIQDENIDNVSKSISRYTISPSSPSITISPNYYDALNKPYGSSILSRYFITEWEWPVRDRISYNNYTNAIKISNQPDIVTAGGVKLFQTYFLFTDKTNDLSKGDCNTALSQFQCSLLTKEFGGQEILQEILKSEEPIVSSKSLKFVYEGAEVPIKGEETYKPKCKTLYMPADPLTEMTIDHWNWVTLPGPNQIVSPTISTPTLGNSISTSTFKNIGKKNMQ
ncbi:MAG: hypothetical protein PHC35_01960 [Deltaproteobacteria bacterium]|nr:hypothetical protein [Deltaproteobacteria bacterium]